MHEMFVTKQEKMHAWIANRKNDRKETTACHDETEASIKKMEPNSGVKEAVVERQEISNEEVTIHHMRACRSETAASQVATETEPDPGTMQSVEEHQEIPKEEAALMPVGGLKKWHRKRNLAAGRSQKPKGRIQANSESRRRLTVADRKMTRRAAVAWRKRNIFRKIGTQENCGPRGKFTAAGIKTI
jgi:hypothetical protein